MQPTIFAFLIALAFAVQPIQSIGQESDSDDAPSAKKPGATKARKGRPPRKGSRTVPMNRGLLRVKDLKKSVGVLPGNRSAAGRGPAAGDDDDKDNRAKRGKSDRSNKAEKDDGNLLKQMKEGKPKNDDSPWNKVNIPDELATGIEFKKPRKGTRFSFNLVDTDLIELVKIMGNITGKAFILGGKAPHIKATIYAPTKITAAEAYQAFLSVLQVNGLTVVPAGRYLKILPIGGSTQQNNPILTKRRRVPPGDQIVTRIHPLEHVAAEEISGVLDRFKSPEGDITVYGPSNTLIITDYGSSIRRLTKLIKMLDSPGTGEQVWIEPVNHADAGEMADRIMEIFDAGSAPASGTPSKRPKKRGKGARSTAATVVGDQAPDTKISRILADERTNSLVIVASEPAYLKVLELLKRLDVPIAGDGTLHVHKLQHADAEELSKTLNNLSKGSRRSSGKAGRGGGETSASLFEGEVQISADKATNSLVVVSSLRDYMSLKSVIDKLDVMQRQVYVEAVIMEVSLDKNRDLGFAFHSGNMVGSGDNQSLMFGTVQPGENLSSLLLSPGMMSGLAAGLRGPDIEGTENLLGPGVSIPAFGVALQALQTNSDANVLSTPHILATDNTEASITVGKNVPMQQGYNPMGQMLSQMATSATGSAAAGLGGAMNMMGGMGGFGGFSIGRQNVGLTLAITPHINDDDQVRLEIKLEISDVSSIVEGLGPNISKKNANTTSVVEDQQTIVIGGLITDNVVQTTRKVPVLGDIPILGFFFRHKKSLVEKRNLLIFLTPYIIRSSEDFREIFNRKMAERREFIERWTAFEYHRVDPHLDWSRTNGAVSEINRVVSTAQGDEALRQLSEANIDVQHTPKRPVFYPKSALKAFQEGENNPTEASTAGGNQAEDEESTIIVPDSQPGGPGADGPGGPGADGTEKRND